MPPEDPELGAVRSELSAVRIEAEGLPEMDQSLPCLTQTNGILLATSASATPEQTNSVAASRPAVCPWRLGMPAVHGPATLVSSLLQ